MFNDPLVPTSPEFLGEASVLVRAVPPSRAFLVDDGSTDQLRAAFQGAASLWGGARLPMLPVEPSGAIGDGWIQAAEVLEVSEVIDFTLGLTRGRVDLSTLGAPHIRSARPLEEHRFWSPHPLLVDFPLSQLRELVLPPGDTLLELAGAGGFGLKEEIELFRSNGWSVREARSQTDLAIAQLLGTTALSASTAGLHDTSIHNAIFSSSALLWVVDEANHFDDAVCFWNYRAIRPRMPRYAPISVIVDVNVARDPLFQKAFSQAVRRTSASSPAVFVASLGVDANELHSIMADYPKAQPFESDRPSERIHPAGPIPDDEPLTYVVNGDLGSHWYVQRTPGEPNHISVPLRRPDFMIPAKSPQAWNPALLGRGRIDITFTSEALSGPPRPAVARLYHQNAFWRAGALALRTDNLPDYPFRLALPDPGAVLKASTSDRGVTHMLSDKGQQILGLIADGRDASIFRRSAVIEIILRLTGRPSRDLIHQLEALQKSGNVSQTSLDQVIAQATSDRRPSYTLSDLRAAASPEQRNSVPVAVSELVERGHLERGLRLKCPLCTLKEFRSFDGLTSSPACSGCGTRAHIEPGDDREPAVFLRLSTLMHTVSVNGGLAPLAAASLLSSEGAYVEPGVNLHRNERQVGETDLLGWRNDRLLAGEAKMSAGGFERADIGRDLDLAVSVGADDFIFACLQTLPSLVVSKLVAEAKSKGLRPRVLDQSDLLL